MGAAHDVLGKEVGWLCRSNRGVVGCWVGWRQWRNLAWHRGEGLGCAKGVGEEGLGCAKGVGEEGSAAIASEEGSLGCAKWVGEEGRAAIAGEGSCCNTTKRAMASSCCDRSATKSEGKQEGRDTCAQGES